MGKCKGKGQDTGCTGPRLIDAGGERQLAKLVQSHKKAIVSQIAEKDNVGYDRKVSGHQCITACCLRGYIAVGRSEWSC